MPPRSAIVRVGLGVLLLAAAGLKLYGLSVSAVPRVGWFAQPWIHLATAEWELVLGAWLLSGIYPRLSWLAALVTFLAFAGVSGYLGWIGVASCGCFGTIQANPWWAFGVDGLALCALATSPPERRPNQTQWQTTTVPAIVVVAVLVATVGVGSWISGAPTAFLARLRGEPLTTSTTYLEMEAGVVGENRESVIEVWNWSARPVQLIGGTSDCSCITTSDLPLTIPPGESRRITIQLQIPHSTPGAFTRIAELWTDHARQPIIRFRIGCRVVERSEGPGVR